MDDEIVRVPKWFWGFVTAVCLSLVVSWFGWVSIQLISINVLTAELRVQLSTLTSTQSAIQQSVVRLENLISVGDIRITRLEEQVKTLREEVASMRGEINEHKK